MCTDSYRGQSEKLQTMESSKDPPLTLPQAWCTPCLFLPDLASVLSSFSLGSSSSSHSTSSGSYFIVWGKNMSFLLPCHLLCFTILKLPLQHPLLNFLTLSPGPLRPSPPVPHFILFQAVFPSSSSCFSALLWFALRSQLPNLIHSCTFRKFQPCVSEKYSGWML